MRNERITKSLRAGEVAHPLSDCKQVCATFSWPPGQQALAALSTRRGLNIADEAVDRYANNSHPQHLALHWLSLKRRAETMHESSINHSIVKLAAAVMCVCT